MDNKPLKKRLKKAPLILLTIGMGLSGCKKDRGNQIAELQKSFTTKQEAKIYLNQKLNEYGKIIAKLSQNAAMRRLVNERVSLKFDGDYNVLLKDLVKPVSPEMFAIKKGLNMSTAPAPASPDEPVQSVNLQELEQALTEPVLVNGETLYPQIYIPFFEEQEEVGPMEPIEPGDPGMPLEPDPCLNAVATTAPDYPNPVIVPYDGEEIPGQETFTGYTYDQNGTLIENIPVDECFAKRHRVWVITLNERVNTAGGNLPTTSGPTPTTPTIQRPIVFMPTLTIKTHKEPWLKGASEINMKYAFSWTDLNNPSTGSREVTYFIDNYYRTLSTAYSGGITNFPDGSYDNIPIRTFSVKEINKKTEINIDFTYAPLSRSKGSGYYFPESGDYLYLVIYEEDAGFWDMLEGYDTVNAHGVPFQILSDDDPYLLGKFKIVSKDLVSSSGTNIGNVTIDNDVIKFVSRYR